MATYGKALPRRPNSSSESSIAYQTDLPGRSCHFAYRGRFSGAGRKCTRRVGSVQICCRCLGRFHFTRKLALRAASEHVLQMLPLIRRSNFLSSFLSASYHYHNFGFNFVSIVLRASVSLNSDGFELNPGLRRSYVFLIPGLGNVMVAKLASGNIILWKIKQTTTSHIYITVDSLYLVLKSPKGDGNKSHKRNRVTSTAKAIAIL